MALVRGVPRLQLLPPGKVGSAAMAEARGLSTTLAGPARQPRPLSSNRIVCLFRLSAARPLCSHALSAQTPSLLARPPNETRPCTPPTCALPTHLMYSMILCSPSPGTSWPGGIGGRGTKGVQQSANINRQHADPATLTPAACCDTEKRAACAPSQRPVGSPLTAEDDVWLLPDRVLRHLFTDLACV